MESSQFLKRIKIINLDRSKSRWKNISKNLDQNGLEGKYERFSGIDGRELNRKDIQKVTSIKARTLTANKAVVGCALSHSTVWRNFIKEVESNYQLEKERQEQWMLVFEDDARIDSMFISKILELEKDYQEQSKHYKIQIISLYCFGSCIEGNYKFGDWPYVGIGFTGRNRKRISEKISSAGYGLSCLAYLINYQGAKELITELNMTGITGHIDIYWNHYQNIYVGTDQYVSNAGTLDTTIHGGAYPILPGNIIRLCSASEHIILINSLFEMTPFHIFMTYSINNYIIIYLAILLVTYFYKKHWFEVAKLIMGIELLVFFLIRTIKN